MQQKNFKDMKVDHVDKFGDNALHCATRDGFDDICEILIKKSKRLIKMKNKEGKTALTYAIEFE